MSLRTLEIVDIKEGEPIRFLNGEVIGSDIISIVNCENPNVPGRITSVELMNYSGKIDVRYIFLTK